MEALIDLLLYSTKKKHLEFEVEHIFQSLIHYVIGSAIFCLQPFGRSFDRIVYIPFRRIVGRFFFFVSIIIFTSEIHLNTIEFFFCSHEN